MYNNKLSIAIPTYNRSKVLESNLESILPDLIEQKIQVFISDDSNNFETQVIVTNLKSKYAGIIYKKNNPSLGHDENFFQTINLPNTDFVWYVGDSMRIKKGCIKEILSILEKNIDIMFVNYLVNDNVSRAIINHREFIIDRSWYLTLSGATIYGRKSRSMPILNEEKLNWRNFVQLGLIMKYVLSQSPNIYWFGLSTIELNTEKKSSYWISNVLQVFVDDWINLIKDFDKYLSDEEIVIVIKSHAKQTKLFSFKRLLLFRESKGLTFAKIRNHRENLNIAASKADVIYAYVSCMIPSTLAGLMLRFLKSIYKFINREK
jgi:abequosyltransferase